MAGVICLYGSQISLSFINFFGYFLLWCSGRAPEPSEATVVSHFSAVIFPVIDTFGLVLTIIKSSVFSPFFLFFLNVESVKMHLSGRNRFGELFDTQINSPLFRE